MRAHTAVALAVALVVSAASCQSAEPSPPTVPDEEAIGSYRVVYEVDELGELRTEEVVVRRPYESRRTSRRKGEIVEASLSNNEGLFQYLAPSGTWQLIDPGRRRAIADPRPLGSLDLLLEDDLATVEGQSTAAGRPCTVVRARMPPGDPARLPPNSSDRVDLCIDRTGVLLREEWRLDGRTVREREAIDFDPAPQLSDADFRPELLDSEPLPIGKVLLPVTPAIRAGLTVDFDLPPDIVPDGDLAWLIQDPGGQITGGSLIRFYVQGTQLVEVEEQSSERSDEGSSLDSNLAMATATVVVNDDVTLVMRSGSVALLEAMEKAIRRR